MVSIYTPEPRLQSTDRRISCSSYISGQDLFIPGRKFVISGIDVLEVDSRLNRKEIEAILKDAREMDIDEYAGWSEDAEVIKTQMVFGEDCIDAWFDKSLA